MMKRISDDTTKCIHGHIYLSKITLHNKKVLYIFHGDPETTLLVECINFFLSNISTHYLRSKCSKERLTKN